MMENKKEKKNLWMLVISIAICITYMIIDSSGIALSPALTGAMLVAAVVFLLGYVFTNYKKKN